MNKVIELIEEEGMSVTVGKWRRFQSRTANRATKISAGV
jgi:hypothetical protein